MLTVGARIKKNRWWALPAAVLLLSLALGGCLEDAEDQCYVFDNPNDASASSVCTGGEPVNPGTGSSAVTLILVASNASAAIISNTGLADQDMTGWTLSNEVTVSAANTFTFPAFTLLQGKTVHIHSATGVDDAANLYWDGLTHWTSVESVVLKDDAGNPIDTCSDGDTCWN